MATNEERREVAARLLNLPDDVYAVGEKWEEEGIFTNCHNETDYYQLYCALLGYLPPEHMHPFDYKKFHNSLADLIEPEPEKTCKNNDGFCSECGQELVGHTKKISVDDEQNITITFAVQPYCCRCGAKVQS